MYRQTSIILVVLLVLLVGQGWAADWSLGILSDGQSLSGELTRNGVGGWVSWHEGSNPEEQPYGAGVIGLWTIAPEAQIPLQKLFPWVGTWLNLPEAITADIDVGLKAGLLDISHDPDAILSPLLRVSAGPLLLQAGYDAVEGGDDGWGDSGFFATGGVCLRWK